MELKSFIIGYFMLLIILTGLDISSYFIQINIVEDKNTLVDTGYTIVYSKPSNSLIILNYYVYRLSLHDNYFLDHIIKINYICRSLRARTRPIIVNNLYIKVYFSSIKPLIPPKTIMKFDDYIDYINKIDLVTIAHGVKNGSYNVKIGEDKYTETNYLLVIIFYIVRQDVYINITRYVPPITYYPNPPPEEDILYNIVIKATDNPNYLLMIYYLVDSVLGRYSRLDTYTIYYLKKNVIDPYYIAGTWAILIAMAEIYDIRTVPRAIKTLFYIVRLSIHYILQALRRIKQYMVELYRFSHR